MSILISGMRRNVNRRKYRNVKKCPKRKRSTSEFQLKLKEKLPTGFALDNQTMNTHQKKSGLLISQATNSAIMPNFYVAFC